MGTLSKPSFRSSATIMKSRVPVASTVLNSSGLEWMSRDTKSKGPYQVGEKERRKSWCDFSHQVEEPLIVCSHVSHRFFQTRCFRHNLRPEAFCIAAIKQNGSYSPKNCVQEETGRKKRSL